MESKENVPVVFISYCWTSEAHKKWVLNLAERLVSQSGVEVILDRWHAKVGHDRFHFMEESIKKADKVLVVCDKNYCEKANNRQGGVGTETIIITPDVYKNTKQDKFIPLALAEEDGDYLLPDFFRSRFALGMMRLENFEEAYEDLERLIWQEPLLTPPARGEKPDFLNRNAPIESDNTNTNTKPVFNDDDEERIVWLLPRGFLLYSNITYQSLDSWGVVVAYYDYNGEWHHSTHYHDSYSRQWDTNIEIQYRKLSIPKADWSWGRAPLNLLQEIREVTQKVDLGKKVESEQRCDYPVYYYKPAEIINLPEVPHQYKFYYDTGKLRDIIEDIRDKKSYVNLSEKDLMQRAMATRHSAYLESLSYLGEKHPSFIFIKEIIDNFDKSFSRADILSWINELANVLQSTLNHEWEIWSKQSKK